MTAAELVPSDPASGDVLAVLHGRVFAQGWPASAFHALLQIPGTQALVMLDAVGPVGFVVVRSVLDEAEIITIGVLPDHQRRGHARSLMETVCLRMAAAGVTSLFLEVSAVNVAARHLYEQLGFAVVGQRKGYYERAGGQADDALVLRLRLPPSGAGTTPDDDGVGA